MSSSGRSALLINASDPAGARNLTLSFEAKPAYAEWHGIQPGYTCANGVVDQASPTKPLSAAFVRDDSPGNVRDGKYSARVVLNPGDHASDSCKKEAVFAVKRLDETEGTESWWGWSWKLPVGWRGTDSWGMLFEFTVNAFYWPSYGMLNFDASTTDSLELRLHTGLTPNPGSGSYNAAYEKKVTLLGPNAPRPMVYGKPGLELEGGFYRANTHWRNEYWWDGMRRRQSEASILAGFSNTSVAQAPKPTD